MQLVSLSIAYRSATEQFGRTMQDATRTLFIFIGGLAGASGVALSAAAAHMGGTNLQTAALFLTVHAPALLALGLAGKGRAMAIAGAILMVGMILFSGDLILRDLYGQRLFPMAAPTGGTMLIFGWLAIALSAFFRKAEQ